MPAAATKKTGSEPDTVQRDRLGKWAMMLALLMVCVAGIFMIINLSNQDVTMSVGGQLVYARVAKTEAAREKGLSGSKPLKDNQAMLFIFDTNSRWGIWMKDMNYSIDILWLDAGKKVIYMQQNVSPATYPTVFLPDEDARYVVELPAGFVSRHGVGLGQVVGFSAN